MTALVVAAALCASWAAVALLAAVAHHREARARAAAEDELCVTRTTLIRTLNAASRGALHVERRSGVYHVSEVLSREGGALHVEAVTTWPAPKDTR